MKLLGMLSATTSKLDKERMLKGISELEFRTFAYAYDPYYVFNMKFRDVKMYNLGEPSEEMFTLLNKLISKRYTGNAAKLRVETFAATNGDLIKLVINHDLKCGVTATTFNKVYKGAIPQFKVQLAKEEPVENLSFPKLVQLKYDGVRLIVINKEGEVKFFTRNGKEVDLPMLREDIEAAPMMNYIIDTEVTLAEGKMEDRTKVSGMINSAMHGGVIAEEDLVLNCFDFMTLSQWENCKCSDPYEMRFSFLRSTVNRIQVETAQLQLAVTNEVHNADAANELYNAAIDLGYEGLVLKDAKHKYTFKRSKDWIKLKEIKTADLKCYAIQMGEPGSKYDGYIGALMCRGTVEGKEIKVNVGSGLKDIQRSMRESYFMHQTIEVKYNAVIRDSVTGEYSLFLPRFVEVRFDK